MRPDGDSHQPPLTTDTATRLLGPLQQRSLVTGEQSRPGTGPSLGANKPVAGVAAGFGPDTDTTTHTTDAGAGAGAVAGAGAGACACASIGACPGTTGTSAQAAGAGIRETVVAIGTEGIIGPAGPGLGTGTARHATSLLPLPTPPSPSSGLVTPQGTRHRPHRSYSSVVRPVTYAADTDCPVGRLSTPRQQPRRPDLLLKEWNSDVGLRGLLSPVAPVPDRPASLPPPGSLSNHLDPVGLDSPATLRRLRKRALPEPMSLATTPIKKARSAIDTPRHANPAPIPRLPRLPPPPPPRLPPPPHPPPHPPHPPHPPPHMDLSNPKSARDIKSTSPLTFSNSHHARHAFAPAAPFSPAEAAVSMLTNFRDDLESVTTVHLARGSVSDASPSRSGSTAESASSMDARPSLHALYGIGIQEFLEQDCRPVFMVDLITSPLKLARPGLHILYMNPALRHAPGIRHLLYLADIDDPNPAPSPDFISFKQWVTNIARGGDSLLSPTDPPVHVYGGITWSYSTVRRRYRFVSANMLPLYSPEIITTAAAPAPFEIEDMGTTVVETKDMSPIIGLDHQTEAIARSVPPETPDYFGPVHVGPVFGPGPEHDGLPMEAEEEEVEEEEEEEDGVLDRHHTDEFTRQVLQSQPLYSSFDWTRIPLTAAMDEHIRLARDVDWAATPLGPIEDWPSDLRTMSNLIMGSPHPAAMYWGPEYTVIYNAAYVEMVGKKHPWLMGQSYMTAWPEVWEAIEPVFLNARECGQAIMKQENRLFISRDGFLEETFFSWSIVPILDTDGQVVGLYNPAFEHTRRKVNERWMLLLRDVGEKTGLAKDMSSFWTQVQEGLDHNPFDVPFALIYSVRDDGETESLSLHSGSHYAAPQLILEGSLGVPAGHPASVNRVDLRASDEGFAPFMRKSMQTAGGSIVVLSKDDGTLPDRLLDGIQCRGFGELPTTVVILPVVPSGVGDATVGYIVMGTNPRRPFDGDYKLFIDLLSRQLTTSMASVVLFEEEIKRGQRAARLAALDRQELAMQLRLKTEQALESENKFARMAEFSPVGMFIADASGSINYCNDMWWQISRHKRSADSVDSWMDSVRNEDRPQLEAVWQRLLEEKVAVTHEFRFKCGRQDGDRVIDTWALMSAYPEKDDGGLVKLIFGCITDISPQKWAEDFQKQRKEEAVEMKRQQENFIDITSHEMRNPLSAVLQCADGITNSIAQYLKHRERVGNPPDPNDNDNELVSLLDECTDAAHTINLCASHQKRIVDDILTLSKLDSKLLTVTPVDVQPVAVLQRVFKMFESELSTHGIALCFEVEPCYVDYGIDWVKLDPSRLQQVLINLMTNAVKFTQNQEKRSITVRIGASRHASETERAYIPRQDQPKLTNDKGWGQGEEINIHFSVSDTGPGLDEDEKKILFQRFSQTSPRTHVKYGGSGLGLFISRILTELQGGEIGVESIKGVGSTFSFYIKSRRCGRSHARPPPPTKPAAGVPARPQPPPMRTLSMASGVALDVLIVEDNIVNQKVLQKQLRNCGNNTHVANHGGEALETLRLSRFWAGRETDGIVIHVVLMDLEMPVMDGMTCTRRIRELERDGVIVRHIPIIAVTAYARPEQIASAKAAGIDDVISKPFRIPELIPKIEELVAKYNTLMPSSSPSD